MRLLIRRYNEPRESNLVAAYEVKSFDQVKERLADHGAKLGSHDRMILSDSEKLTRLDFYSIFIP